VNNPADPGGGTNHHRAGQGRGLVGPAPMRITDLGRHQGDAGRCQGRAVPRAGRRSRFRWRGRLHQSAERPDTLTRTGAELIYGIRGDDSLRALVA
jgi:hypothetical protein